LLIISHKPPRSWTDEDVIIYETKLSDIARRFMNLEALQKEIAIPSEGIDARRITVTYPDVKQKRNIKSKETAFYKRNLH